jgi:hypothetical protein
MAGLVVFCIFWPQSKSQRRDWSRVVKGAVSLLAASSSRRHTALFFFSLIRIVVGGVQTRSTRVVGRLLSYYACPGWLWRWRIWWNEDWQGKPMYSEKTCPSATLSTINPTWPDPDANPDRRCGKPATNRLSYDLLLCLLVIDSVVSGYEQRKAGESA